MFDDDSLALNVPRIRLSLRVEGDTLDPEFITQQLGITPSFAAAKGTLVSRGERSAPRANGIWTYRLEVPADIELGDALRLLIDAFPDDTTLWEELTSTFTVEVFCGLFLLADNQSTVMDADVLAALGRRGWSLSFDLYGPFGIAPDRGT